MQWWIFKDASKILLCSRNKHQEKVHLLNFQAESEIKLESKAEELERKIRELEREAKSKGINLSKFEEEDEIAIAIKDPKLIEYKKKQVEKHAINALNKKFYAQFKKQREQLEDKLNKHNDFIESMNNDETNTQRKSEKIIDVDSFPLLQEINEVLAEWKESVPLINSKLPWKTSKLFKPRSSSSNSRLPYKKNKVSFKGKYTNLDSKKIVVRNSRNNNSKSVNDLNNNKSSQNKPISRNLKLDTKQASTIEILRENKGSIQHKMLNNKDLYTPYAANNMKPTLTNTVTNKSYTSNYSMSVHSSSKDSKSHIRK